MRILVATPSSFPEVGGLEQHCHDLCDQLARLGNEVLLFSLTPEADPGAGQRAYTYYREQHGWRWPRGRRNLLLWALKKPFTLWHLVHAARRHQADCLLVIHWSPLGYLCPVVTWLTGAPFICFALGHEIVSLPAGGPARLAARFLRGQAYSRAGRVFTNSHYTQNLLIEIGVPAHKVEIFPPGIVMPAEAAEAPDAPAAAKQQVGLANKKVILQVGRLVWRKAHDTVIESLPAVLERAPNAVYIIVGDGPERPRLEALARSKGLEASVVFAGRVETNRLATWYTAADVFVMPVRASADGHEIEGLGIVFLESYLHARPVIAGRSGGVEDAVVDGTTGFLVPPDDAGALAEKIVQLLGDEPLARQMGQQGRDWARQHFDWPTIAGQMQSKIAALVAE